MKNCSFIWRVEAILVAEKRWKMPRISKFFTLIILWIFRRKMSCIICTECSDPLIKVTDKGLSSLIEFSRKRNGDGIYQLLIKSKTENTQVLVHENCRKRFNDKCKLTTINAKDTRDTRKSTSLFNWKQNCLFFQSTLHWRL